MMEQENYPIEESAGALSVASYLGPLCFAPLLVREGDSSVRFHMKQGMALLVVEMVIWAVFWILFKAAGWFSLPGIFVTSISLLQRFAYLCVGFLIYTGINNAIGDCEKELPFVGGLAKRVPIVGS
jgi:hypothetical protein